MAESSTGSDLTLKRGVMAEIKKLAIRFAKGELALGLLPDSRIPGALEDLGHRVGRTTISRILKAEGIKPAPDRPSSWKTFIKAHWGEIAATDFFTTEVWTTKGLVTYYTLFVIDLKSRQVHIAGSTPNPDGSFMAQVARNLTDTVDGFLLPHRILLCDRDKEFTEQFGKILNDSGVDIALTPRRAPNGNAYAERFVRSIKEECLRRMIMFGERSLHRTIREYVEHYHDEVRTRASAIWSSSATIRGRPRQPRFAARSASAAFYGTTGPRLKDETVRPCFTDEQPGSLGAGQERQAVHVRSSSVRSSR